MRKRILIENIGLDILKFMNNNKHELSIIIPARNEMFLARTIQDILENIEADTEIIAVLDGEWADPGIPQHDRVNVIYIPESIGQRASTNLGVNLSKSKFVLKCDAHCSFDKGFDRKMIEGFKKTGDNVTAVPIMRNLHAYSWKCMKCGKKWYQGPTPTQCQETNFRGTGKPCDSTKFKRKMMWIGKRRPQSVSYCFDATPHFQYFEDYKHREPYLTDKKTGFTETMSLQGSCFMSTRKNYWDWELCDEKVGSWGNQGLEVACATWLTGHKVLVNRNTWYAHLFRTSGGDFSFPYEQRGREVQKTKKNVKDKFWDFKHPKQKYQVSWLIKKFSPMKGWSKEDLDKLLESESSRSNL